jgi:hypothetical protein
MPETRAKTEREMRIANSGSAVQIAAFGGAAIYQRHKQTTPSRPFGTNDGDGVPLCPIK